MQPTSFRRPPAACLALAELGAQFTARVGSQQAAGIEPVRGASGGENGRNGASEFWIVWTTVVPECQPVRHVLEAQNFLHATVAVGGDDEDATRQAARFSGKVQNDIVMKLTLGPVIDVRDRPMRASKLGEQGTETEMLCEAIETIHANPYVFWTPWVSANAQVKLRADQTRCERSEPPKTARLLQRMWYGRFL